MYVGRKPLRRGETAGQESHFLDPVLFARLLCLRAIKFFAALHIQMMAGGLDSKTILSFAYLESFFSTFQNFANVLTLALPKQYSFLFGFR